MTLVLDCCIACTTRFLTLIAGFIEILPHLCVCLDSDSAFSMALPQMNVLVDVLLWSLTLIGPLNRSPSRTSMNSICLLARLEPLLSLTASSHDS